MFDEEAQAFLPDLDSDLLPARGDTTETYLKLAAIDIDDVDAMLEFQSAYGELGVGGRSNDSDPWEMLGVWGDRPPAELVEAHEHVVELRGVEWGETLVEWQWAILHMRDLIAAWRVLREGITVATNEWQSPLWAYAKPYEVPWGPGGPFELLATALHCGLRPFTPQLRSFRPGGEPVSLFAGELVAWNVCCLELFNHIVEQADYKTCAREDCRRLYVRQEGRADYGQYRTIGTKYCSERCARLVTQRNYRRRQRTKH